MSIQQFTSLTMSLPKRTKSVFMAFIASSVLIHKPEMNTLIKQVVLYGFETSAAIHATTPFKRKLLRNIFERYAFLRKQAQWRLLKVNRLRNSVL